MKRVFTTLVRMAFSALAVLAVNSTSFAQVTTFFGNDNPRGSITSSNAANNAFLSSFFLTGTDNLDSYTPFLPSSLSFGNGTSATATNNASFVINDASIGATWSISSPNLLVNFGNPSPTVFEMSRPVNGFGLYVVNAGDAVANQFNFLLYSKQTGLTKTIPVNANSAGTGSPVVLGPGRASDSVFYFGVKDTTPFDIVTISPLFDGTQDGLLFDNISIGFISAVPEPSTYALIGGLGLAGVGSYLYKRRQAMKKQSERFSMAR